MIINGEQVKLIGRGAYSKVYRSIENPNTVYILSPESDHVKEILCHVESPHVPYMRILEDHYSRGKFYNAFQTEYTETPRKEHGQAYIIAKKLELIANTVKAEYRDTWRTLQLNLNLFQISDAIMDVIEQDSMIPESIKEALRKICIWSSGWSSNYMLEFQLRNLGVKTDGTLILRDIIFIVPQYNH